MISIGMLFQQIQCYIPDERSACLKAKVLKLTVRLLQVSTITILLRYAKSLQATEAREVKSLKHQNKQATSKQAEAKAIEVEDKEGRRKV